MNPEYFDILHRTLFFGVALVNLFCVAWMSLRLMKMKTKTLPQSEINVFEFAPSAIKSIWLLPIAIWLPVSTFAVRLFFHNTPPEYPEIIIDATGMIITCFSPMTWPCKLV